MGGPRHPSSDQVWETWGRRSRRRLTSLSLTWLPHHPLSRRTTRGYRCRRRTRSTRETTRRRLHHREVAVKEWAKRGGGTMMEIHSQAPRRTMLPCCHRRRMEEGGRAIMTRRSIQRSGGIGHEICAVMIYCPPEHLLPKRHNVMSSFMKRLSSTFFPRFRRASADLPVLDRETQDGTQNAAPRIRCNIVRPAKGPPSCCPSTRCQWNDVNPVRTSLVAVTT